MELKFSGTSPGHQPVPGHTRVSGGEAWVRATCCVLPPEKRGSHFLSCLPSSSRTVVTLPHSSPTPTCSPLSPQHLHSPALSLCPVSSAVPAQCPQASLGSSSLRSVLPYLAAPFPALPGSSPGLAPCLTHVCFTISALATALPRVSSQAQAAQLPGFLRIRGEGGCQGRAHSGCTACLYEMF